MRNINLEHYLLTIEKSVRTNWEHPALSDYQEDTRYTYGEMAMEVERVKEWMSRMGIRKGDKIAICAKSCAHWGISFLSIVTSGCVAVSILPDFTEENINYLVRHSEAKLLFVGESVNRKTAGTDFGGTIVVNLEKWEVVRGTDEQISQSQSQDIDWHTGLEMDDIALINYTSGTTDKPKGVMLSSKALSSNVTYGLRGQPNGPGDQVLGMLPLAHIFGIMFDFLYQMAGGAHVVYLKKAPSPTLIMKAFREVRPFMILTVPLLIEKIINSRVLPIFNKAAIKSLWLIPSFRSIIRRKISGKLMEAFGGKLRVVIIGGAPLNKEVENCLSKLRFPFTCGYGMTECAPLICYASPETLNAGSVGRAVDGIEIKINSDEPERKPGEILVRGDNVFVGYFANEDATNKAFDKNGWFHTGDMGIMDRQGNLTLKGRCKNMILGPSGQNIYPEEIEAKLLTMPRVQETIVIARDKKIIALVYPDSKGISKDELRLVMGENLAALNESLPKYSQVAKIELVEKEFEKTPKNSIKRFLYK
ncbi:MAG: AMP-binding protein [Paludibacteraceae bacterium]|nr:AMP-binding protein [Paludibacteraceae bacterium]